MGNSLEVIVCGHLCLDLFPHMENVSARALLMPGQLVEVGPLNYATGGLVSNCGLVLQRLGVKAGLMANVGDDLIGQTTFNTLKGHDPALPLYISVKHGQVGSYTIVLSFERSDRTFLHCAGTNTTYGPLDIDYTALAKAKLFHFGYPPLLPGFVKNDGQGLTEVFKRAKATGIITSLDMTLPDPQAMTGRADWRKILKTTLPYVDIFLPTIDEILFMLRRDDYERWHGHILENLTSAYLAGLASELLDMGVVIAGMKLGQMGLYLKTGNAGRFDQLKALPLDIPAWANVEHYQRAFEVDVVGTTGAGDAAYAGFLASLLHGFGPKDALRWACAVGACNVEAADSISGVRTWQETERQLSGEWPLRPEFLPGFGSWH